jgi:hypothetical protein
MKTPRLLVRLLVVASSAFPAGAFAVSLDLRPGAWEVVMATSVAGLPIPQEALAKMPPDQRAKFDEAMKARAGKVNTTTMHNCVTQEDLDRGDLMENERENCSRNVIEQSARGFEVEETCTGADPSKTHMTFAAKSREAYTATIERSQGEAGKVHVEMTGRWVESKCAPEDED